MNLFGVEVRRAAPKLGVGGTAFAARSQAAAIAAEAPALKDTLHAVSFAPKVPARKSDAGIIDTLPPFGTNPPNMPMQTASVGLEDRAIWSDPRDLWYLALPSRLTPNQVQTILRSALGGDIWQQWQLQSLMMDTWPMLRKCSHEIRSEVSYTNFKTKPYCEDEAVGPSDESKARADLVSRAMRGFRMNPFTDEQDFTGMVYDICDAMLNGIAMTELIWEKRKEPNGKGKEWMPRAAAWVHPRSYTFSNTGVLALFSRDYHRIYSPLADSQYAYTPDVRKFICSQFKSKSGSSLGAGLIRPLAWYWSAVIFCKEWMLASAQKYGNPFMDWTYDPGTSQPDLAALDALMAQGQTLGYIRHVKGTTLTIHPATASAGTENAQRHLMETADSAAMFLLLGQEGTTKSTPGKLGGEDTKAKEKRARVQSLAQWVGATSLKQFARVVLMANYGNDNLCPDVVPDFTETADPMAQAQTDAVFITNKVPVLADEFYKRNNLQMPEAGDRVLIGGQLCELADDDQPVSSVAAPPPQFGPDGQPMEQEPPQVNASAAAPHIKKQNIRRILARQSDEDLREFRVLVERADAAAKEGRVNGEWDAVTDKISQMAGGRR